MGIWMNGRRFEVRTVRDVVAFAAGRAVKTPTWRVFFLAWAVAALMTVGLLRLAGN